MMEKLKGYALAALAVITGVLYALFRSQQRKTAEAESQLGKALFKNETQENDRDYQTAKENADKLVADYQSGKRSDTVE